MKKGLMALLSLLVVAVLAGCGGGAPEPEAGAGQKEVRKVESNTGGEHVQQKKADEKSAATPAAAKKPAEGSGAATPAPMKKKEAKPAEGSGAGDHAAMMKDGLEGTTWDYKGISLSFKKDNKVFLKGGPLAALAPDGTEADYTLKDGVFEVSVLGQTYSGTYADGKLTVDGTEAVMK